MGFKLGREKRNIKSSKNVKSFNEGKSVGNFKGTPILMQAQEGGTLAEARSDVAPDFIQPIIILSPSCSYMESDPVTGDSAGRV